MIDPTVLEVSGERIRATYEFHGDPADAEARVNALRVEQTIEFPADLVPDDDIQREIIGRVESSDAGGDVVRAVVSYAVETTGYELPQLMNVLWGNSALLPGIRLVDFELPASLLDRFPGPRFGIDGLRTLFDAPVRPLLATALKPMGLPAERLATEAFELALGGIDLIKDDHSLANQPFAPFVERVERCAAAVAKANEQTGFNSVYMPSVNAPYDQIEARVSVAVDAGAGALLVLPGLTGLDHMRNLATRAGLPIMGHPAFLGSYSVSPTSGIAHGKLYGTLMRLAGADLSIFPNYGGRFSFSRAECRDVARSLTEPLGALRQALPSPGGGMTLARVGELVEFYGNDVALLIGGDLHRGESLVETAAAFRDAAVEAVV
jgi:ribulose-bisphosphate carboxylase large chain